MAKKLSAVLYTMEDCPFCQKAKQILQEFGVKFEEKNVTESPKNYSELLSTTHEFKLPTVILNGIVMLKPGEDKLRAMLNYEINR